VAGASGDGEGAVCGASGATGLEAVLKGVLDEVFGDCAIAAEAAADGT